MTEELLRKGDEVVVYDSLYKGHREAVVEGAAFVKGALLDAALLRETLAHHDDYPTPDGTCVRDYIHVVDLAQAHVLALHALAQGHPSSIYNLGCGCEGDSVKQVIDCSRTLTGREIPVRQGPRRPGDPAVLIASSARITRELGWRPQQQKLEVIVESAWRWMQRRR